MVAIAIGCTTVAELICNAIFVNNGWLVTGSFWGVYDYVRAMTCETILLSLILMGMVFLIKWRRSLFREKSQIVTALIAVSVLAGMYPWFMFRKKAACGFYRCSSFYPDHYDLHVPPAHRSGDRKTSGK